MVHRILIVDDDPGVQEVLTKIMQSAGFETDSALGAVEVLTLLERDVYAMILMDINMPDMNGFDAIKVIRARHNQTPIIIISARKNDVDTLHGLDIGADAYIVKPFNPVTIGATVKALIRRFGNTGEDSPEIMAGPFVYNSTTLRLYKNGREIELTAKENAIMKVFIDNRNRIFPKETLFSMIWRNNDEIDENTISVYINRLRAKIEDDPSSPIYIRTVRGIGYRFVVA